MTGKQTTNMEVKRNNRNRVFRYLCKHDRSSNPDIAYELKMSLPTVTQITRELIESGLVIEAGELKSTGGRRAKALSAAADAKLAAGVDITKNHVNLVLTNLTGEILKYERIPKPYAAGENYCREISEILERFLDESRAKRESLLGIGISYPGIVDLERQMITSSHALGVRALPTIEVGRFFSYPCSFSNDANAGAYAEGILSEEAEGFFYLSLSNTVGGALFNKKELTQGKNFRCGEVGHMTIVPGGELCYCGKKGCLDAYCSARRLSELSDGRLECFFQRLDQGERDIVRAWDQYTTFLAIAINNIRMLLDCDIILGGYVGSCMADHIRDVREKVARRDTFGGDGAYVRSCRYQIGAAALGAALQVIERFAEQV